MIVQHDNPVGVVVRGPGLRGGVDDKRAEEPVDALGGEVGVVPVGAVLVSDGEFVPEGSAGGDGAVGDARGAVHEVCAILVLAVPVQGGGVCAGVVHVDDQSVAVVAFEEGTGELVVDYDEGSGDT